MACRYVIGLSVAPLVQALAENQMNFELNIIGTRMRNGLMASIYRKCLLLSNSALQSESTGRVGGGSTGGAGGGARAGCWRAGGVPTTATAATPHVPCPCAHPCRGLRRRRPSPGAHPHAAAAHRASRRW
jgi:hypothetical protein